MKGIRDIRVIFIVAVLVVGMACQQTADPAASPPSPTADAIPAQTRAVPEPSPSPTPTPIPTESPATPEPTAEPEFEATLEGEALAQYERLSEEHDLDIEGMARFLGTEMVTEWLGVVSGPESDRFASGLEGDDRERHDGLSRLERYTFELIALIEPDLAMDWLWVGPGPQAQEGEGIGQSYTGPRTPAKAFAPDVAQADSQLPRTPIIGREALVQYARLDTGLDSAGHKDFEFFVNAVGPEAAEEALLALGDWGGFHIPSIFTAPLPSLETALSPNEATKFRALDQHIRDSFVENWKYGLHIRAPDPSDPSEALAFTDPKGYVVQQTEKHAKKLRQRLIAIPAKLPRIEELVSAEGVAEYNRLHPDLKEQFRRDVGVVYASGRTVGGEGGFPPPMTDDEIKDLFGSILATLTRRQEMSSEYQNKAP